MNKHTLSVWQYSMYSKLPLEVRSFVLQNFLYCFTPGREKDNEEMDGGARGS